MKIGKHNLTRDVLIVAEIGNNHEGQLDRAGEMIRQAAAAGAGAVKFQTICPSKLVSSGQPERLQQLRSICLKYSEFEKLAVLADREKIIFLSTPFDIESVNFLVPMVPAFKVASGDNLFYPLLDAVAATAKPLMISTGLCRWSEVVHIHDFVHKAWRDCQIVQELALLHCVAAYPTPDDQANLLRLTRLQELNCTLGYSDHTLGIEAAVLSVALGARIIEKHFTLDKTLSGFRDHRLSADPEDLAELVRRIDQVQVLLGAPTDTPSSCEIDGRQALRRSIAAAVDMHAGCEITTRHITWVRPAAGLSPGCEKDLIGKVLNRPLVKGQIILPEFVI